MYNQDLFSELEDSAIRVVSYDGHVEYKGGLLPFQEANHFFDSLLKHIDWQHDHIIRFDQVIKTKRKVAFYAEKPFHYRYSNTTKVAFPWTPALLTLKKLVEVETGAYFNACLLNLYHDGEEGMAWHSDREIELQERGIIASLSLGAERKFSFKHKQNNDVISVLLQHGSLLTMKGDTQHYWLHCLPISKKVKAPRINLTFRMFKEN